MVEIPAAMDTLKHALGMVLVILAAYFFLGIGKPKGSELSKPVEAPRPTAEKLATTTGAANDQEAWFTLRQLIIATETGIFVVPPGTQVDRLYTRGSLYVQYQGRMYPVQPHDLTSDEAEAAAVRPPAMAAAGPSKQQFQPSPTTLAESSEEKLLNSLDAQIASLRAKIVMETNKDATASEIRRDSMNGVTRRVNSRNITIQRLLRQVSELEARRAALGRSN